jgi:DNA-directed RNA polymerase specialized sigma24 family protein
VRGLVFTCAWRKVIDYARSRDRRRRRESDVNEDEAPASESSLDDNVGRARVAVAALARLSFEDQVLVRCGVGDSDEHGALVQAAEAMGITEDALRARLKRARQKFSEAVRRVAGKDVGEDE